MVQPTRDPNDPDAFRAMLRRWDAEINAERDAVAPPFAAIQRRIAAFPSPMEAPRWSAARSLRLAAAVAWAQVRVVPWLIVPVVLITITVAVLTARFFGVNQGASAADASFTSVLLVGIVVTLTMALSSSKPDSLALATPLGPQVVVMARIAVIVLIDVLAGLAASITASAWGYTGNLTGLVVSWLFPLALIAGAVTFTAIWVAPWAGVVTGIIVIPLAAPTSEVIFFFGMSGLLWNVLTPAGLLAAGAVLLIAAASSARHAAIRGAQSA